MNAALLNTLAVYLNILTLAGDILVDFNLVKLIVMSKRNMLTIGRMFVRGGWFDIVPKYTVIPMQTETVDRNQFKSYYECVHMMQRSFKHAIPTEGQYYWQHLAPKIPRTRRPFIPLQDRWFHRQRVRRKGLARQLFPRRIRLLAVDSVLQNCWLKADSRIPSSPVTEN